MMDDGDFGKRVRDMTKAQEACLFEKAREWAAGNEAAAYKAVKRLVELEFEVLAVLRTEARRLTKLLRLKANATDDEKVTQLLEAFGVAAKFSGLWKDARHENAKSAKYQFKAYNAAHQLDTIGEGRRSALTVFLDGADKDAQAMAGALLIKTMPERCVPLLEEITRTERWLNAGFVAIGGLLPYEGPLKTS